MDVSRLDMATLRFFDTLYRVRSVSQAARDLDLPQSTASRILSQLRQTFEDELFVRTRGGMQPTPAAERIAPTAAEILSLSKRFRTTDSGFNVAQQRRTFVLAGSDIGQYLMMNAFKQRLTHGTQISVKTVTVPGSELSHWLGEGNADIAIGAFPKLIGGMKQQRLYQERYKCFCDPEHPFAQSPSLATYLKSDHMMVSTHGLAHSHRMIESKLSAKIAPERVRLVTSSFLAAVFSVRTSALILTAPGRAIGPIAKDLGLASIDTPFQLDAFEIRQYWHTRFNDDPGHQWLRKQLRDVFQN